MTRAVVILHGPGSVPKTTTPGDFFLVTERTADYVTRLIRAGERVDWRGLKRTDPKRYRDITRWSHSGGIETTSGGIIEALAQGVQRANIDKYRDDELWIVSPHASIYQRTLAVEYLQSRVGVGYDYLDFVGLAAQALLGWQISIHSYNRLICSGEVAMMCLKYVPVLAKPPEAMKPADLAVQFGVETDYPWPSQNWFDRLLALLSVLLGR